MINKYLVKLYVKLHYMWFYITHLGMYQKIRKMRKNSMKDKDYFNPVNHTRLIGWIIIISSNIGWWVCVWYMGFFITILWTIIGIALYMLWWNLKDMRA